MQILGTYLKMNEVQGAAEDASGRREVQAGVAAVTTPTRAHVGSELLAVIVASNKLFPVPHQPARMKSVHALRVALRTAAAHERQALTSLLAVRHVQRTVSFGALAASPSYRPFSNAARQLQGQQTTFSDPDRADLWYHLSEPPTPASGTHRVFAVSLISTPPPTPSSATIIGWLPAEHQSGQQEAGLNDFVENRM